MSPVFRPVGMLALSLVLAAPVVSGAAEGQQGNTPDPTVLAAFQELQDHITGLSRDALHPAIRGLFLVELEVAERAYRHGEPCFAAKILRIYLHQTQALRTGPRIPVMEDLYTRGWFVLQTLLGSLAEGTTCAGQAPPDRKPEIDLTRSDNQRLDGRVRFGPPRLTTVDAGGEIFTEVAIPGLETAGGPPGRPAVPTIYRVVAVPHGAKPRIEFTTQVGAEVRLNLMPFQRQPVDQGSPNEPPDPVRFADPPFVKDAQVYATNAFMPATPCSITPLGESRDLQLAQLACSVGQYNPVTDTLRLFTSIDFRIAFDGGDGTFLSTRILSPFESASSLITDSVLNRAAVRRFLRPWLPGGYTCLGFEFLILTHPSFRPAADRLAAWKREKGISTTVFNVADGPSNPGADTAEAIDAGIESEYTHCLVRPSYVLLIGDAEFIPTFYITAGSSVLGSDFPYAKYDNHDPDVYPPSGPPDFAVGRIPVDTLAQANTVVDKIIRYESDPPFMGTGSGAPFYTTAAFAAQYQCCRMDICGHVRPPYRDRRAFVETAELVRNALLDASAGYNVDRIYTVTPDPGGVCQMRRPEDPVCDPGREPGATCPAGPTCGDFRVPSYQGALTPARYHGGASLPPDLLSGFSWSGDTADIAAAWNEGRFLILHRDHGWPGGWLHPQFTTDNVTNDLHNGDLLPVVYSVNCASGLFDNETIDPCNEYEVEPGEVYFAERLLRSETGGAVGMIADSRNSPTTSNNALTRGFFDATWPDTLPDFGEPSASTRRLGDILNWGKRYLLDQHVAMTDQPGGDPISGEDLAVEYLLWHVIGDPTLEMWTGNPWAVELPSEFRMFGLSGGLGVEYAFEGATITALQETQEGLRPIGRAPVIDGRASLDFVVEPVPGAPLLLSASFPNAVSRLLTRTGLLPDLVVEITGPESAAPGADLSSLLAVEVSNRGDASAPGTVNADGTPKPPGVGYMIDIVLSTDQTVPEGFAPLPPPDVFVEDGLLVSGRVSRTPDVQDGVSVLLSPAPPVSSDVGGVIPRQIPLGDYFLCARIDPGAAVAEADETNNVGCAPIQIR